MKTGAPAISARAIAARGLALGAGRPGQGVELRGRVAPAQRLGDEHLDRAAVLRVDHHQAALVARRQQCPDDLPSSAISLPG